MCKRFMHSNFFNKMKIIRCKKSLNSNRKTKFYNKAVTISVLSFRATTCRYFYSILQTFPWFLIKWAYSFQDFNQFTCTVKSRKLKTIKLSLFHVHDLLSEDSFFLLYLKCRMLSFLFSLLYDTGRNLHWFAEWMHLL